MSKPISRTKIRSLKKVLQYESSDDTGLVQAADNVHLYQSKALRQYSQGKTATCFTTLSRLNSERPKWSIKKILDTYRACSEYLMDVYTIQTSINNDLVEENQSIQRKAGRRSGKRWTPEEDDALIETAARPDSTIMELALNFGRSPGAVQSRITYLVGIEKISQQVCGRLTGFVNGEPFEGDIKGVITKKPEVSR